MKRKALHKNKWPIIATAAIGLIAIAALCFFASSAWTEPRFEDRVRRYIKDKYGFDVVFNYVADMNDWPLGWNADYIADVSYTGNDYLSFEVFRDYDEAQGKTAMVDNYSTAFWTYVITQDIGGYISEKWPDEFPNGDIVYNLNVPSDLYFDHRADLEELYEHSYGPVFTLILPADLDSAGGLPLLEKIYDIMLYIEESAFIVSTYDFSFDSAQIRFTNADFGKMTGYGDMLAFREG